MPHLLRVRVREGKRAASDGPFSGPKMIGGHFILDCDTREEAIAVAGEAPAAECATVEARGSGPRFA